MGFLDDVGRIISDTSDGAIAKAKEITDTSKIKSMISDETNNLNRKYAQIGKMYLQLHKDDCDESLKPYMESATASIDRIAELEKELNTAKGLVECPNCGTWIPVSSVFCTSCGKSISEAQQNADGNKCPNCGSAVSENMKFCIQCGTPLTPRDSNTASDADKNTDSCRCPLCGSEIGADLKFCTECGAKLK